MLIPTDPKNAKALREFYTQQRTQLCSLGDLLGEPWASHFNRIKSEYDSVLEKLGPSEQVPAALDANAQLQSLYSMLVSANSLTSMLSAQMNTMKQTNATALCSAVDAAIAEKITKGEIVAAADVQAKVAAAIPVAVADAIKTQTEAGAIVPKEMHAQLCSAAKEQGLTDGKNAAMAAIEAEKAKLATVDTRKAALQTAGLPVPEKDILKLLGGTEEEFAARKTAAESRITALKTKSAYNSKLGHYVWLDEPEYKAFEALATEVLNRGGHEPLAGPVNATGAPLSTNFAA